MPSALSTNGAAVYRVTASVFRSADRITIAQVPKFVPWECVKPVAELILIAPPVTHVSTADVLVSATLQPLAVPTPNVLVPTTACNAVVSTDWSVILKLHADTPLQPALLLASVYPIRNVSVPCAVQAVQSNFLI